MSDSGQQRGTAPPDQDLQRSAGAEATLVGWAQEGDVAAFETLVRQYQRPVFGLAQRMLADRGDAEDVVQDTFVMVWRRIPSLDDLDAFRGWVYQIATRRCLNVLRARSRHATVPVDGGDLETAPHTSRLATAAGGDPAAAVEHTAQLSALDTVLQTLPDEQTRLLGPARDARAQLRRHRLRHQPARLHRPRTYRPGTPEPREGNGRMALAPPGTQLGCGRDIDEVWDRIGRAPDAHERVCPYCQAARADLAGLARATQAMRDDDTTNPDLEPSPGVLDRILAVARAEVRRGRRLPLDQPDADATGVNTVSEQAVTAAIRRTGDQMREVQIRRWRHHHRPHRSRADTDVGQVGEQSFHHG